MCVWSHDSPILARMLLEPRKGQSMIVQSFGGSFAYAAHFCVIYMHVHYGKEEEKRRRKENKKKKSKFYIGFFNSEKGLMELWDYSVMCLL